MWSPPPCGEILAANGRGQAESFTYDEVDKAFRVRAFREFFVHYLEAMQRDLELRED